MADGPYYVGSPWKTTATFSVSGTNTDPTTVTLYIEDPSGNVATYTYSGSDVLKSATGVYYYTQVLDEAGPWQARWVSTGTAAGAAQTEIKCLRQSVTP